MNTIRRHLRQTLLLPLILVSAFGVCANAQQSASSAGPPQSSPQRAAGETPESAPVKILTNFVEAGGSYEQLSDNFGRWSGGYFRSAITTGKNTWNAELNGQHEFGDAGTYMDAGDTYAINSDWYAALTLGSSVGGFFWPRSRVDAFVNRKWLERKQLITTLGFGYDHARDVHSDHSVFIGTTYYFEKPWIVEDGIRFNISSPSVVFASSGFIAVTEGQNKQRYVTLNVGIGEEAYQLVGSATILTRFPSQTATLTWRQWVGKNWGFDLVADFYHSPYYHRGGGSFGLFKEF